MAECGTIVAMVDRRERRDRPALDAAALERLALRYVERFATTRGKLADYLRRKLRERGSAEGFDPLVIDAVVARFVDLGYIDDAAWARAKAGSLTRRGYGSRRIDGALRAAGIDEELAQAVAPDQAEAWAAAETFARRRRIGAFADQQADRETRRKQLAAMLRAGHGFDAARKLIEAMPGAELSWSD